MEIYTLNERLIIDQALQIMESKSIKYSELCNSPKIVGNYLKLLLGAKEHEELYCLFLNNKHQLIESWKAGKGSISSCHVYPREMVKKALSINAANVILGHNHPSGNCEPSSADIKLTKRMKEVFALIDIKLLDSLIVTKTNWYSLATNGECF